MDYDRKIVEYVNNHLDLFKEVVCMTGHVCMLCHDTIKWYESAYEEHSHILCRHCMARFTADSHRATNMKEFSDNTATELRRAIQDFKRRIM